MEAKALPHSLIKKGFTKKVKDDKTRSTLPT
jgi:hypothetical protein